MQQPFVPLKLPAGFLEDSIDVGGSRDIPPDFQSYRPLVAGLVLDISLRHHPDSKRYLDIIKEQLVQVIVKLEETDDRVYVYHPDSHDLPAHQGIAVSRLMGYSPPPLFPDAQAVITTLALVGGEPHDFRKRFVYITDRNTARNQLNLLASLNSNKLRDYRCDLHFIGIGEGYNPALRGLFHHHHHLDDPYQLAAKVTEVFGGA